MLHKQKKNREGERERQEKRERKIGDERKRKRKREGKGEREREKLDGSTHRGTEMAQGQQSGGEQRVVLCSAKSCCRLF